MATTAPHTWRTLTYLEVLSEQVPSLLEGSTHQAFSIEVEQVESEEGDLNLDLGLHGVLALARR